MTAQERLTLPLMFTQVAEKHRNSDALSFVGETPLTYQQVQLSINSLAGYLEMLGIKPGDKVAILSTNMPNWGIAYLAVCYMGAIAVPLLPDFLSGEIENILKHSGSRAIFVSDNLKSKMDDVKAGGVMTLLFILIVVTVFYLFYL